jgi:hypothetical protein
VEQPKWKKQLSPNAFRQPDGAYLLHGQPFLLRDFPLLFRMLAGDQEGHAVSFISVSLCNRKSWIKMTACAATGNYQMLPLRRFLHVTPLMSLFPIL